MSHVPAGMTDTVKDKLINSAISVFAEHGYRHGKVADIVKGADANIAAVNYHFGSKENLFVHALRKAHRLANAAHPTKGDLPDTASAEEKIKTIARGILRRSFDPGEAGDFNRIMSKTIHVPGSPIELILNEVRSMEHDYLEAVLAELLDTGFAPLVELAKLNFFALATIISKSPRGLKGLFAHEPTEDAINELIEVQVSVVLTTIKSMARHLEQTAT
ncbi:MAG: TetR/AcrR family transcriptional regulator [Akkermansiaceae bacterium]|nr:TetR/AcrR family transcriptional regulator [Akkermansiaceae bacterium]